jgi:hypothetical protein
VDGDDRVEARPASTPDQDLLVVELFQVAVYRSQLSLVDPAVESGEPVSGLDGAADVPLLD